MRYIILLVAVLAGCASDVTTEAFVTIPPDTVTVVQLDTTFITDTTFVTDTLAVTDTVTVPDTITVVDTVIVISPPDTVLLVKDSVTFSISTHIKMRSSPVIILGEFIIPEHVGDVYVWTEITLSGNSQRDEAFALTDITENCVVPDNPSLGTAFVFAGISDLNGTVTIVARHGRILSCYRANVGSGADSIHFTNIRFVFWRKG